MAQQVSMQLPAPKAALLGIANKPAVHNIFYDATEADRAGDHKKAERIYMELLNGDFDNPVILAAYGMCLAAQEKNGLAFSLLNRSLQFLHDIPDGFKRVGVAPKASMPLTMEEFTTTKKSEILNAIGTCHKHENHTDIARQFFTEAQSLIPLNPDIQNNLATLYINEGDPAKALPHLNLALGMNPAHPQAKWNKSLVLLEMGEYKEGWELYDAGFEAIVRSERNYAPTPLPAWDGTPGKKLVVYGEQGIGDEIMFASMLPDLLAVCPNVVFDCHKKLHSLFHESFPAIDIYPTREDPAITWPQRYTFDARVALGSLGRFFRPSIESFPGQPFIHENPIKGSEWAKKLADLLPLKRPKIGISWIGGYKRTRIEVRSLALEQLLPILKQDADFISLQYTPCSDEIAAFERKHGITIHHFPEAVHTDNYADTAALVANLDLVITVCTSVVHLAGSMGVPTWVLTPSRPAWRYQIMGDTMPWYGNTITLFRQKPNTVEWPPVVEEVSSALNDLLGSLK